MRRCRIDAQEDRRPGEENPAGDPAHGDGPRDLYRPQRRGAGRQPREDGTRGDRERARPARRSAQGSARLATGPGWIPPCDKSRFAFSLGGACHPEKHHEAPSFEEDLANLRKKVDAGVEFLITQLFLDNEPFFRFVERAREMGIDVPIVPGIMPMVSLKNLHGAMQLSPGSKTPPELAQRLMEAGEDADRAMEIGVRWATRQCRELLDGGAPGIHFYTLNKSPATRRVHRDL
jgi:methylenetetrahydrofolate reductase (NADPH)